MTQELGVWSVGNHERVVNKGCSKYAWSSSGEKLCSIVENRIGKKKKKKKDFCVLGRDARGGVTIQPYEWGLQYTISFPCVGGWVGWVCLCLKKKKGSTAHIQTPPASSNATFFHDEGLSLILISSWSSQGRRRRI
jgi:hypothetical protein